MQCDHNTDLSARPQLYMVITALMDMLMDILTLLFHPSPQKWAIPVYSSSLGSLDAFPHLFVVLSSCVEQMSASLKNRCHEVLKLALECNKKVIEELDAKKALKAFATKYSKHRQGCALANEVKNMWRQHNAHSRVNFFNDEVTMKIIESCLAEETVEEAGKRKQDNNGTSASHSGSAKRPKGPERPKSSLNKVAVSAVHTSTQVGARREEDIQTEEQEKVMALYAQGLRQLPTVRQYGVDSNGSTLSCAFLSIFGLNATRKECCEELTRCSFTEDILQLAEVALKDFFQQIDSENISDCTTLRALRESWERRQGETEGETVSLFPDTHTWKQDCKSAYIALLSQDGYSCRDQDVNIISILHGLTLVLVNKDQDKRAGIDPIMVFNPMDDRLDNGRIADIIFLSYKNYHYERIQVKDLEKYHGQGNNMDTLRHIYKYRSILDLSLLDWLSS